MASTIAIIAEVVDGKASGRVHPREASGRVAEYPLKDFDTPSRDLFDDLESAASRIGFLERSGVDVSALKALEFSWDWEGDMAPLPGPEVPETDLPEPPPHAFVPLNLKLHENPEKPGSVGATWDGPDLWVYVGEKAPSGTLEALAAKGFARRQAPGFFTGTAFAKPVHFKFWSSEDGKIASAESEVIPFVVGE